MEKCPICKFPVKNVTVGKITDDHAYLCNCYRCGRYSISDETLYHLNDLKVSKSQIACISGWIRENQDELITADRLSKLLKLSPPTVAEKANRILMYLAKMYPLPGQELPSLYDEINDLIVEFKLEKLGPNSINHAEKFLPIFSISYSSSSEEIQYLLYDYLYQEKDYLELDNVPKITPNGWAFIENYKSSNAESKIAFIAMKFEDELKKFSEQWVETAIRESGFEPIRIDKYEHNNLIDDEIIANIRRSRFLIADLTGNSYGVYFEAGYAKGINIPVIYICSEEYFKSENNKVHFDTNHYPFILWNYKDGEDLKKKLKNRIEATIGLNIK
jgi:hypothetical protein